ncbi:hypothetical protein COCCU_07905 [Corynebacterium occultum]|uniref:Transcription antitermination protein NusB n=1 Tax=Corynebacterium occultum TaxID=2675219 RepID=A0A6B8W1X3_9CORY|nr:transcription antitermination factor NusB [Corynebacterium occultum]QGU07514.1 hypothetical protein COCCU_07905 [Corynebacterium occultum]
MSDPKNYRRHGARYRARRRAVDILFEAEARDLDPVAIIEDRVQLSRNLDNGVPPVADYTRVIVAGAAAELDRIDDTVEKYLSEDWELHRIPAVDRAIMRVATWEMLFNPDVPVKTALVEGVELASEYSNDAAAPYIHALLDDIAQVVHELRAEIKGEAAPDVAAEAADVENEKAVATTPEAEAAEQSETAAPAVEIPAEQAESVEPVETEAEAASADPVTGDNR